MTEMPTMPEPCRHDPTPPPAHAQNTSLLAGSADLCVTYRAKHAAEVEARGSDLARHFWAGAAHGAASVMRLFEGHGT